MFKIIKKKSLGSANTNTEFVNLVFPKRSGLDDTISVDAEEVELRTIIQKNKC